MAECVLQKGGGGAGSDDCTATPDDLKKGVKAILKGSDDEPVEGNLEERASLYAATSTVDATNKRLQLAVPARAIYNTAAKLYDSFANIVARIGLTAGMLANGQKVLDLTGTYKGRGNATADKVLKGSTFSTAALDNEPGTMENMSGAYREATSSLDATNKRLRLAVPVNGFYNTAAFLYATYANIASLIGLTAAKLANGQGVLGLTGTYKGAGNAVQANVESGKTFSTGALSNAAGSMAVQAGQTITPTKSTQTVSCAGKKMSGNIVVNPIPAEYVSITSGVTVFNNGQFPNPTIATGFWPKVGYYDTNNNTLSQRSSVNFSWNSMSCSIRFHSDIGILNNAIDLTNVKSITVSAQVTYADYDDEEGNWGSWIESGYVGVGVWDASTKKQVKYNSVGAPYREDWVVGSIGTVTLDVSALTGFHFVTVHAGISSLSYEESTFKLLSIVLK